MTESTWEPGKMVVEPQPKKTRKEIAEFGAEVKKISARRTYVVEHTVETLKKILEGHKYVDVGKHAASALGVSELTLKMAIEVLLNSDQYVKFYLPRKQVGSNLQTTMIVMAPIGTTFAELVNSREDIHRIPSPPEIRKELIERRQVADHAASLEQQIERINQSDISETEKRALRAIAKSESRAKKAGRAIVLKDKGYSNVAIGKTLGVSESTVRSLLKPYDERGKKIKKLLDAGNEALEDSREKILEYFTEIPEFEEIFGEGMGEAYILRIHTAQRDVLINVTKKRVEFTLKFWAERTGVGE